MKILILDDALERLVSFTKKFGEDNTVVLTTTAKECIEQLNTQFFDLVCLDHDLGGKTMIISGKETGYEVAEWIVNNISKIHYSTRVVIHSFNPVGARNMVNILRKTHTKPIIHPGFWV